MVNEELPKQMHRRIIGHRKTPPPQQQDGMFFFLVFFSYHGDLGCKEGVSTIFMIYDENY